MTLSRLVPALVAALVAALAAALAGTPAAAAPPTEVTRTAARVVADVVPAVVAPADVDFALDVPDVSVTVPPPAPEDGGPTTYSFGVYLAGHQAALDLCQGWVWEDFGGYGNVVSSHNYCGGAVVLGMSVGDTVRLAGNGAGTYRVTATQRVKKGAPASVLQGGLWMQTCYFDEVYMRLVRLTRI